RIEELRQATPNDRRRIDAKRAFAEAMQTYVTQRASWIAFKKFEVALSLMRAVADRNKEVQTLNYMGEILNSLGEWQKALDYYGQAVTVGPTDDDRPGKAVTFNGIGLVYDELGERQKALDYYNQALVLWHALADPGSEAVTLHNIGLVYLSLGEVEKALEYF